MLLFGIMLQHMTELSISNVLESSSDSKQREITADAFGYARQSPEQR
jgi:hypothetical protein